MIWHETADPAVIVMLTQMSEAGRDKCFAYFPLWPADGTLTVQDDGEFGDGFAATVQLLHVEEHALAKSTIRLLRLTVGDASKTVWHLLFEAWPDFSVPEGDDCAALLELLKLAARAVSTAPDSPPVIHCSAGVGRSGTFIALDYLLGELEDGALDDFGADDKPGDDGNEIGSDLVFETVNSLREQRMTMVQSDAQLSFIYGVLKQKWLERRQQGRAYGEEVVRPPELPLVPDISEENGERQGDDAREVFAEPTQVSDRGSQLPSHV
jgi:protein-tyrosine phosphatase